jgi:isocitrate lyase
MNTRAQQIADLEEDWSNNPRWKGLSRPYSAADVVRSPSNTHSPGAHPKNFGNSSIPTAMSIASAH